MASVFDIVTRRQKELERITGLDFSWQQALDKGIVYTAHSYCKPLSDALVISINSKQKDSGSFATIEPDTIEVNEVQFSYRIERQKIRVPYTSITSDVLLALDKESDFYHELSPISRTLRDHFFSLMNAAANFKACMKDAEKHIKEISDKDIQNTKQTVGVL